MKYFDKLLTTKCSMCDINFKVVDSLINFWKTNSIKPICDKCRKPKRRYDEESSTFIRHK